MNAQNFINKNVQSGKDIVFAEDHLVTTNTFDLMNQTILDNPGKISAVSLEIPAELQPFLDKAAAGNINAETFVKQVRITTEQSHLDAARNLLNHEEITQKDYDQYEQRINQRVEDIINGSGDEYPLEQKIEDEKMFGSMYHLTQTAEKNGVKVIANDFYAECGIIRTRYSKPL